MLVAINPQSGAAIDQFVWRHSRSWTDSNRLSQRKVRANLSYTTLGVGVIYV